MYILVETSQNLMEWWELHEIGWHLTQCGTGDITILDCMPVRDILAISAGTERN